MKIRASRSPLLASIRELLKTSSLPDNKKYSRREFLKRSVQTSALLAASPLLPKISLAKDAPKIAIIGGGIAGLNAAYTLRKAGIIAHIYEGSNRIGGRIFTGKNILAEGLATELGGEFIDSSHSEMLSLAKEFKLELIDRKPASSMLIERAYYFGSRLRSEKEVIEAFNPYLDTIRADANSLPKYFDHQNNGNAATLDTLSIAEYFRQLGISGWVKDLLDVAYITEFGLETSEQSALNFITMIGTDISGGFEIFGSSDERYVIEGGNTRLIDELNKRLSGQSAVSQKLESIRAKGKGFTLSFDGSKEVDADILLLTIPFTMLREIEIKAELADWKRKAINELGYGNHTKVMAGFTHAPWQVSGYAGEIFSDENFQLCWDNSGGNGQGLTSFTGGKKSIESGKGSVKFQADKFIGELDKIFPGTKDAANGKNTRFNWTTYPFTKGSYSCYKPGQWTSIHGAESKPIGNLFFAGEHTSLDFQGFMNGGADSGKKAAEEIIALVK